MAVAADVDVEVALELVEREASHELRKHCGGERLGAERYILGFAIRDGEQGERSKNVAVRPAYCPGQLFLQLGDGRALASAAEALEDEHAARSGGLAKPAQRVRGRDYIE